MTSHSFTPGPWSLCPSFGGNEDAISIIGDDSIIATAWDRDWLGKQHDVAANAHLIAAAPDMFAALTNLVNSFEKHRPKEYWDAAREAIAKAEGR